MQPDRLRLPGTVRAAPRPRRELSRLRRRAGGDGREALTPLPIADLAAGALSAVNAVLAALYERQRTGRGRRLDVSMTHQSHHLISYRLGGDELPRLLTGGFACYQIYATADDRFLTVGALEPKFFQCLCQLIGQPELAGRQYDLASQPEMIETLSSLFRRRALDDWLQLFDGEEVAVGPVQTLAEAHAAFGEPEPAAPLAEPGEHTVAWRTELRVGHRD